MAFSVTPTSGEAPYFLSAAFDNKTYIDGVNFIASVRSSSLVGSCPLVGTANPLGVQRMQQLLASGSVDSGYTSVASGSCLAITLSVSRVSDGVVVAASTVTVDNV